MTKEKEMTEVKKLGMLSVAKITAIFGAILGLFYGIFMGVTYSFIQTDASQLTAETIAQNPQIQLITTLGWSSVIVIPIIFAVLYFIAGIGLSLIYNLAAQKFGGIKIQLK